MSQMIYKLQVLPSLPEDIIAKYKMIIRKFIWNNGTPRIAYGKLIMPYDRGGLALQDLKLKDKAIKAASFYAILDELNQDDNFLKIIIQKLVRIPKAIPLLEIMLKEKEVKRVCKKQSLWSDFLAAWNQFNITIPRTKEAIRAQPLWYNTYIMKEKINYKAIANQCTQVSNLIDQQGHFKPDQELQEWYSLNFLELNQIKSAIPKEWKRILTMVNPPQIKTERGIQKLAKTKNNPSKIIYQNLLSEMKHDNTRIRNKWEEELNCEISDRLWNKIMQLTFKLTNCTKLRHFQYRLMHRILTTNTIRSKWNKDVSSKCAFCNQYDETYTHLFYECKIVMSLWINLVRGWTIFVIYN